MMSLQVIMRSKQLLGQVWRQDCQDVVLSFELVNVIWGWQVTRKLDELSVIIEDVSLRFPLE